MLRKKGVLTAGLLVLGVILLAVAHFSKDNTNNQAEAAILPLQSPPTKSTDFVQEKVETDSRPTPAPADQVLVEIEGAVVSPGVYQISRGDRVRDLVQKAGGFTSLADQAFIAQQLNLTAKLSDGSKFYIPFIGEKISSKLTTTKKTSYPPTKKSASQNTKK